ncbi:MAG TPA: 2-hydroxyacid dehydrogenase [Burkholderiaceae bacterium]|nr:2-hydroxyacid dehydrogenase [Burkholderiaceae bacterium]
MSQPHSDQPELLVLRPLMPAQMEQLEQAFHLHRYDLADDPDALLESVGTRIRGVVTAGVPGFKAAMLPRLPAVEIVSTASVGTDSIDVAACKEKGVHVTNTPDVLNDDVADLAIGLVLNALRRLGDGHDHVRSGQWSARGMMPLGRSLKGKRMGIVGLGRIGLEIAKRAEAMKMEILYTSRSKKNVPYAYFATPAELAANCDVLMLACPGGAETRHLVNASVLAAMHKDAWLINISRGSVVDEAALIDALERKAIGGAGLDVFENEPHVDTRFHQLENVILFPHHASGTIETRGAMSQLVVDNMKAHFSGQPLPTPV